MYQRAVLLNLPKAQPIDIEFSNVVYETKVGFRGPMKQILKGMNGRFKSGELTAIMGPSGAGKSTLLNILTGFQTEGLKGNIQYIGIKGKRTWNEYRKECCYIQQEDQLYPLFSVYEIMTMATNLKIGNSINRKAKRMLIDDILENLDLIKSKETRCDKLSGGQKKRLNIGLELIDNPPLMFLDEPTTGLDSLSSFQCLSMLQSLAKGGRTIICTIHQPSAILYEMFDHIYLLAEGRCMYQGAPKNTVAYFSAVGLNCPNYHNPADYMMEVVTKEYGNFNDHLAIMACDNSWRAVSAGKSQLYDDSNDQRYRDGKATVLVNPPTEIFRFWVLLNRCFIQLFRDWTVTHLKVAAHFLVGMILGLLYVNAGEDGSKTLNNVGFFLVTTIYLCYTSMMPAVLKFPSELMVLKKEQFNNWYKLRTYYIAMFIANLPVQVIFALVYSSVSYLMTSQPLQLIRFLMFLVITILTSMTSESVGLLLGTMVNPINGTFLGAIITCALLIFAGFLVLFNHMSFVMYYVSYASYLRYSLDGLVQSVYGFNREVLPCPHDMIYCHYRVPKTILDELAMSNGKYWLDVVVLFVAFIAFRIVTYCTLKRTLSTIY
ncbi:hypothetical protein KM043_011621 [Ampulex compressa]|nr:hypothetical protein KM043_011621 [Ampulex compressa]